MRTARKPLATIAVGVGALMIVLGAPALAEADGQATTGPAATSLASGFQGIVMPMAADDAADAAAGATDDGADVVGTDSTDPGADPGTDPGTDGLDVLGTDGGVAAQGAAISGDDGNILDGDAVVGTDQAGQGGGNGPGGDNGQGGGNGQGAGDDGNSTGGDGGGDPSPAANDPVLGDPLPNGTVLGNGLTTDRNLPSTGAPTGSILILLTGLALTVGGITVLGRDRRRVSLHRA